MNDTHSRSSIGEELAGTPGILSYEIGNPPRHVSVPVTVVGKNSFKTHNADDGKRVADDFKACLPNQFTFTYDDEKYGPQRPRDFQLVQSTSQPTTAGRNILTGLIRINDWLLSPKLRKQQRKMLADQQAHIAELYKQGRNGAAQWNEYGTWLLWGWYVLKSPFVSFFKLVRGKA